MNRFFTNKPITNNTVTLTDESVHHIKDVIKLREGEELILVKNKKELRCRIDKIGLRFGIHDLLGMIESIIS